MPLTVSHTPHLSRGTQVAFSSGTRSGFRREHVFSMALTQDSWRPQTRLSRRLLVPIALETSVLPSGPSESGSRFVSRA